MRVLIVEIMGRWSVCQVVWLYNVVDIAVMSGDVVCCSVVCGTLVGVSVFSIICSELLIMSGISYLFGRQCVDQSVECVYTSPVSIESGLLVTCCMQCAMS